jgi:hypothetical protein
MLNARRRRDTERALNTAARLFSSQSVLDGLYAFYRSNKKFELLGFGNVAIVIPFPVNLYGDPVPLELGTPLVIHSVIALYTSVIVIVWFVKDYLRINKYEKTLGIGEGH